MKFLVRYIKQSDIDLIEQLKGEKCSPEAIEKMKSETIVEGEERATIRLVDHLRKTGCIASYTVMEA